MEGVVSGRGFTLVELLVVVAIIAILAALLIPQAVRMVDKGNSARCMGNLRQLYLAAKTYQAESGEPLYHMGANYPSGEWVGFLYSQLNVKGPGVGKRPPGIFGCPSSKGVQDATHPACDYGHNAIMNPNPTNTSYFNGKIVPNPSKVLMFADQFNPAAPTTAGGRDLSPFANGGYLGYRHGGDPITKTGRANVIYYDGHGETAGYDGAVIPHSAMTNPPSGYWYTKPPWQPGPQ